LALAGAAAVAQPALPDAGELQRRSQETLQPPPPARQLPSAPRAAPPDRGGPQITVHRFVVEGATLVPEEELQARLAPWRDRPASLGELQAAVEALADAYRKRGWFARAQIPPQDATDGTLRIRIIEGRFGRLRSTAAPGTRTHVPAVEALVGQSLRPGEPYSQDALERGLLLANDLPGVQVDGVLQAGEATGTSDLELRIADQPLLSGYVGANNAGSRATGRAQANAQLALDNPGGRGDQATLGLLASEDLRYAALGYSFPLGSDGLRARFGLGALDYRLGDSFAALDARGRSRTATAALAYPVLRTGIDSMWVSAEAGDARYKDESLGVALRDRHVTTLPFTAWGEHGDALGGGGFNTWRIAVVPGKVRLGVDAPADAAGPRTAGRSVRVPFELKRDQRVGDAGYLRVRLAGQWADSNLDSSQKFGLGGPYGVRAFPGEDGQGDAGVLLQVEWHRALAPAFDGFVFGDGGHIRQHVDPWPGWDTRNTGRNAYGLAAAGLGLTWSPSASLQANLTIAWPLGGNPHSGVPDKNQDGSSIGPRGWIALAYRF
jgi:hemolysin activation/secretion protein